MCDDRKLAGSRLLAKILFVGSVFLLPVENAFAVPNINLSTSFSPADGARTYMDIGGTWNGTTEVGTGDSFTLSIANTGADPAYDISDIPVTVPAGFVLASGSVSVSDVGGGCPNMNANASQAGAGNPVTINIFSNNNTVINPGCTYSYVFRLETNTTAVAGTQSIGYTVTYNTINNDNGSAASIPGTQNIDVNAGSLSITKSTATALAIDGDVITYDIVVSSTGSGGLFDVVLTDIISADLSGLNFTVPDPPPGSVTAADEYTFEYLAAGEVVSLTVDATVAPVLVGTCPILQNDASLSERTGVSTAASGPVLVQYDFQFTSGLPTSVITHNPNPLNSFCEFCGDGQVSIIVQNPTTATLSNFTIVEDLQASGLVYIPGSTTSSVGGAADPSISGTQLTWTSAEIPALANLSSTLPAVNTIVITFGVRRLDEGLITADRNIFATADFDLSCLAATQTVDSGQFELPIHQPLPNVIKDGRNYDAGQGGYSDPVYGSTNDDVIWRVNVQNAGRANMEALRINDSIDGNFNINFICPTEASAVAIAAANGVGGAPCIAMTDPFDVDDPFGNPPGDEGATFYDVPPTSNAFIYYVGRILNGCTNNTNSADISWGCELDSSGGGSITVPASTGGITPAVIIADTGVLSTNVVTNNLIVTTTVTGSNPAQPLGSKGLVTITLENQTGGSVKNITLRDILPAGYVMDNTFVQIENYAQLYGGYPGMIDTITRDDVALGTADPLDDLEPTYTLTSSTVGLDPAEQVNMLRHGDIVSITFGIIMIEPDLANYTHYDLVADLDIVPETTGDGTDPANALALTNQVFVDFVTVCDPGTGLQPANYPEVLNFNSDPEDLDVAMSAPLYIVTNDITNPVPLTVLLTNDGGHEAADYFLYVSFGEAMTIVTPAPGCIVTSNPPPRAVWDIVVGPPVAPAVIDPLAVVYECTTPTPIAPGATVPFTFTATQNLTPATDDLTFRADIIGEITLSDGTPLTFPQVLTTSTIPAAQIDNAVNNYTLDAVRSRVLGFNLTKVLPGNCTEDNPPPLANTNVTIGEDCTYHIQSGGWFGFQTPGFTLIEVNNIVVTDDLPDGQGYISHDFTGTTFAGAGGIITTPIDINSGAGSTPLEEGAITWGFNPAGNGINQKDEFFQVDITTRVLNDPVDTPASPPNGHSLASFNIARTSFTAVFDGLIIPVSDALSIPGYPVEAFRRIDLTVTEPSITVVKEVCNETLYGVGIGCTNFTTLANDGDTNDSYIYRITLLNELNLGVQRAPAYNVISTDTLDVSDLMFIADFSTDGLDNDGDGLIDALDPLGEGTISDNVISNGTPAVITVSNTHSASLQRVDPGASVTFYYRVDPDDAIAPLQTLTNTVTMSYDSLDGDFGSQTLLPPLLPGGIPSLQLDNATVAPNDVGRARIYTSIPVLANVQMIPLVAQPKAIIELSNTTLGGAPQDVVVGEEIRYELTTQLPVANLRQFVIRDELPAGIRCIEGQVVNLNAAPYSAAGFNPGGTFTPTCTSTGVNDFVEWNFGDQELTMSPGITRFDFVIDFIARVENTAITNEANVITNGGGAPAGTDVTATYVNEAATTVVLNFAPVDVVVREPVIALTKSFAVLNSDAADILTVTVTATNNGTAAAYNLRVLDELVGTDLTYVGNIGGTDPPDNVDIVTLGANRPIFSWNNANPDFEILTGAANAKTFTFDVRVDTTAQPLEILDNTIEGIWDSIRKLDIAGVPTALNASGTIGADGSMLGLRNGTLPIVIGDVNDYETTASASTSVLPLTITKTDLSLATVPTIGAQKNFKIAITLPEGTTSNLIVFDDLDTDPSGLSYVLTRAGVFDVSYTFQDIATINGVAPDESVFNVFPVDNAAGTITWDIGTVITDVEDDYDAVPNAVNPTIIISYFARIDNDLNIDATDTLENSATANYNNGETAATEVITDGTLPVTVVEPDNILVTKFMTTNVTNPGIAPDGGDILEYEITVTNNGSSEAFDVNIVDTLPAELLLDTGFTATALVNGVVVPLFNATPMGSPAGPLTWGRTNGAGDNTLDIPAGQDLVLTYRAVVQTITEPNTDIINSVLVDWTSLDDIDPSSAYERDGDGCPVITAPDDYCVGPIVETVTTIDNNSIVKSVILDIYNVAPLSTAFDSIVRVGDTVTYRLDVNIQEGRTRNVNVQDSLPVGMTFVDVVSINGDTTADYDPPAGVGSNFSYATITAINVPAAGATGILNWNLGTITNDAAGDATTDTLVIEYRARVTEDAGIPHVASTPLTNTADLSYIDGNGNPSPIVPRLTDDASITVLQPILDSVTKVDRDGSHVSGDPVIVATDIMNFRLQTCNTNGLAPAYGIDITDDLPTQLDETSISGPSNGALQPDVRINGTLQTLGVGYLYTPPAVRGGQMAFVITAPVNPGECVDIDFDIGFYTDFGGSQSWANNVSVDEYWSLPADAGQQYIPAISAVFNMNNAVNVVPPAKSLLSPASGEATIGDEIVYRITVPSAATNAALYDVTITDTLDASLIYVSASDVSANSFTITDNTVLPIVPGTAVNLVIDQIPAGQQAIIELHARVDNNINANASVNFTNTASYTFADAPAGAAINGGNDSTVSSITIIEPVVAVAKAAANQTKPGAPDAGDILRYTITLTASGGATPGDLFSDAFDISIADSLSLGLLYNGNLTVDGGNTINPPIIAGDGIVTPQTLNWSLAGGNADIDVSEGTVVTVSYDVLVLDSALANQDLTNAVNVQWHSRDGPDVNQRDGSGIPALNDYFNVLSATTLQTTPDNNIVTKTRVTDTFGAGDNDVRIGDIIEYRLLVSLQEGTHPNAVIADTLPAGMQFEETVSINGNTTAPFAAVAPFIHPDIAAPAVAAGLTTITWTLGNLVNPGDNLANNNFEIIYRARVLNLALLQLPSTQPLLNSVDFNYGTATVPSTQNDTETVNVQQPNLAVTKIATPAGGDAVLDANEVVTYTVDINNSGTAPAYDTELRDILPLGMRLAGITSMTYELLSSGLGPQPVPAAVLNYNAVTGNAIWNFDTGVANQFTIPPSDTLRIVYQVQTDASLGAGLSLTNEAQVQFYYSFDDEAVPSLGVAVPVREIYGPSNIAQETLTTGAPNDLLKESPVDLDVSIGETFTYRITVPGVPQPTALHDVQILDDLTASAADLLFVSVARVSGSQPWTPTNIGTIANNLIIADVTDGIDIPANEQVVIDVTVTLRNQDPPNIAGLVFNNTASYTFNQIDDDNATVQPAVGPILATPMTIVEPDLTLDKRGPAGTVNFATAISYTLVVENIGTGPAFDTNIVDQLPDATDNPPLTGGTCDTAPVNIVAGIYTNDESTELTALTLGTDFTATHTAAPTCELVITTITDIAAIEAGQKLIVTYDVSLDPASQSGALLTNIAGVTQWFSLDTAGAGATGEIREYTRLITDGTTAIIDHEDAFTVTVDAPVLDVQKIVENVTTSQVPGSDASPGDVLRYTIIVSNTGILDAAGVTVSDVIPANATYIADSVTLNGFAVGQPDAGVSPLIAGIDISSSDLTPPLPTAGNGIITVGQTATITFDVLLDAAITSGTVILNQALVDSPSTGVLASDDPNISGNDDPLIIGDEDPTETLIASAPAFLVEKISTDITGDPAVLVAGDSLRYTITVKNIGQEDSVNSLLSDQIPANTTYVANSTTLNGVAVADPAAGISALAAGLLINAPENTTTGFLRADTTAAANNVATITFDVVISNTVIDGTVISNQGFFSGDGAGSGIFPQQPSDDPGTALVDDPTLDIVGNVPVVDVLKTVAIQADINGNGFVDPGDTLRYTITTTNIGAIPATGVVLTDAVPANTTYVANSVFLNTLPVAQPDGGLSPLIAGIDISSSDLTPPLPTAGNGTLSPGGSAVVIFDVLVNAAALPGTIISNQGFVSSNELPVEPSDADGIDANGDQPTIIVVGNVQQLAITKQVLVVGGGVAQAGGQLEYVVRVTNIGSIAASNVVITDDLDFPVVGQMTYVAGTGLLNGLPVGISFAGSTVTADYSTTYSDLPIAGVAELRFRVLLSATLNIGDTVSNTGEVSWNVPASTVSATVDIDIGGTPGSANLNGQVWHDTDFDNAIGAGEALLQNWTVELYRNNVLLANTQTDANGVFQFSGLVPNLPAGDAYELRYIAPGAAANTATLGTASSVFTNGPQRITDIFAASGSSVQNLNLPRQPNGIVYDSVLRVPVAGVQLSMINQTRSNQLVPASCFEDPNHQNQVTLAEGFYKFDLNFSDPTRCAEGDEYEIQIQPPANGYIGTASVIIPPVEPVTGTAQDVPNCPGTAADSIPATALHCENSVNAVQPDTSIAPRTTGTDYYLKFLFNNVPSTDQIFNNHIPVDPELDAAVAISKVAGLQNVTRSQLVPYTITLNNTLGVPLQDLNVVDNFPAGFKYVSGSSRIDGVEVEPLANGRQLTWTNLSVDVTETRIIKLLLVVGSGVGEGEYVNTAHIINSRTNEAFSGVASATVQVIPDPTFDCTDIIGKIFDDANHNAYQDQGEKGLAGVQVATAKGLRVTTDAHGRFHITCAVVPNEVRGSNFIMKVDDRTLPSGYRITTENPRVQRATRGKMLKFNFGATIHRVVRLDLADGVFEKGSTELRTQWRSRIDLLIVELQKDSSILRLSYLGENETESEVEDRLDAIEELISERWEAIDCCYKLTIEKEVFWRKSHPSDRKGFE